MRIITILLLFSILSCTGGEDIATTEPEEWNPPYDIEIYPHPPRIRTLSLKNNETVLYWNKVVGADGYIVLYGTSTDYTYAVDTPERVLYVSNIDPQQTWYVGVKAKKGAAITPQCVITGILPSTDRVSTTQRFDRAVLETEKAAWKAQKISAYSFTALPIDGGLSSTPVSITVLPDTEPEMEYSGVLDPDFNGQSDDTPFSPLEGKTIDELFESIAAYASQYQTADNYCFIQFNETYHYPEMFRLTIFDPFSFRNFTFSISEFEDTKAIDEAAEWEPDVSPNASIWGYFLNYVDDQVGLALHWTGIGKATGYTVLYGTSADYGYSADTSKEELFLQKIDFQQTWYVAVQAWKKSAISPILMETVIEKLEVRPSW